jgi:hypothetical protein
MFAFETEDHRAIRVPSPGQGQPFKFIAGHLVVADRDAPVIRAFATANPEARIHEIGRTGDAPTVDRRRRKGHR